MNNEIMMLIQIILVIVACICTAFTISTIMLSDYIKLYLRVILVIYILFTLTPMIDYISKLHL